MTESSAQVGGVREYGLPELWQTIWKSRNWLFATVFLFAVGAVLVALLTQPVYRSTVVMAYLNAEKAEPGLSGLLTQVSGLATLGFGLDAGAGGRQEALATFRSRRFTEGFINRHNLLPVLYADLWDPAAGRWLLEEPEEIPTLDDAYQLFVENVRRIEEDPVTGLITLTVDWHDPQLASEWAQQLVQDVDQQLRDNAIVEARRSLAYLNTEMGKTQVVTLQLAISRLIEEQIQRVMLATVREAYTFRVIDPAFTPEPEDFVRPNRPVIVIVGIILGGMVGVAVALLRGARRRR